MPYNNVDTEGHFQRFSQARRGGVCGEAIILLLQPSPAPSGKREGVSRSAKRGGFV
jgi:hypothetical protein